MDFDLLLRVYVWIASIIGTMALCAATGALLVYAVVRWLMRRAEMKSVETMARIADLKRQLLSDPAGDKAVH